MKFICLFTVLLMTHISYAQDLPLREIPDYPDSYSEGTILARFTEGLGYRYYWATDGLNEKDLEYRPSNDARTTMETLIHLYGLARFIKNAVQGETIERSRDYTQYSFTQLRKETLEMLAEASKTLRDKSFQPKDITYPPDDKGIVTTFPYWHLMNGPISDALYHTGQIVSFRRSSGNPMNPGVSVFMGKTRE